MYFGSKRKSAARRLKLRDRIISMLLAVSLLCGNPIVLPTGAAELVAYCEIEEHSHSEECYTTERVLTCGVTQDNHVHSEACKQTEKTLTCTIVEQVHEHTDACYTTTTNLTCTEHVHTADCAQLTCTDEGHAHTDACYAYTCESPNSTHQHTDSCYTTESVLKCDYHQHTDECYTTTEVNTCGVTQDNHTHSYACYGGEKTLSCTQEEHTHTSACYSNPEADLETAENWKDTLPKEDDFTGTWAKDLLAVAESQLGYKESDKNYQVAEDGETPIAYFLNESKTGCSPHFASAATIMFRMLGIPARYVVGYAASESLFTAQSDGTYTAVLQSDNAHAWTEIYISGTGWLPVETTPGQLGMVQEVEFYGSRLSPENTETAEGSQTQDTQPPTPDEPQQPRKRFPVGLLLLLAVAAAAVFAGWAVWRRRVRDLGLDRKKPAALRVRFIFAAYYRRLVKAGMPRQVESTSEEFVQWIEKLDPELGQENFQRMMCLVLQSAFGRQTIRETDVNWMRRIYRAAKNRIRKPPNTNS